MYRFALYSLWLVLPLLQGAVAWRIWQRKLYREYPLFFAYTLEQLLRFAILFYYFRLHLATAYMHAYASLQAIEAVLQIGVICELFSDVFSPYRGIRQIGPALLQWGSVFFLFSAILVAVYSAGADSYVFLGRLFALERSVEIVQAGLLVVLLIASSILALTWKRQTLGIALGFGLFTTVNLVAYTVRFQTGASTQHFLSLVCNAAYDGAAIIWVWAFYAAHQTIPKSGPEPSNWDPHEWNDSLTELLHR